MLRFHRSHILHPKELDRKTRTFMAILLDDFGFSMIAIFIPVFLWIEGYTLTEIALFHVILFAFRAFTSAISVHLAWALGTARAMQIGFISGLVAVGSMVAVTTAAHENYLLLGAAAVVNGVSAGLYWAPRHLLVEMITSKEDAGKVALNIRALDTMVITLGPLIGGFVAAYFGSEYALSLSFSFILISLLYVVKDKEAMDMIRLNKNQIRAGDIKNDIIANLSRGYDIGLAMVAWPLFIYLVVEKVELVGVIGTISGLLTIPLMLYAATRVDGREKGYLKFGTFVRMLVYPFRALIRSFSQALGVNIIADLGDITLGAAHMSHYYKRAGSLSRLRYTYYMEIMFPLGAMISWVIISLLSLYFNNELTLQLAFVSAVAIIPFTLFLNRIKPDY